jgi:hypothetical protein
MDELVKLSENPLGIKGHCRIELHDAETGELSDVQEGDNFVSPLFAATLFRQVQKILIGCGVPNGGMEFPNINNNTFDSMFRYLVLTDSQMAESPSIEVAIPGTMIGWANRSSYAGGSSTQGSINVAESFGNENLVHWVFDFPTNCANGTIGSVCWAYVYPETPGTYMMPGKVCGSNWSWIGKCARTYTCMAAGDGYLWGYVGATLYKLDPVTLLELSSYTLPNTPYQNHFIVSGGYVFYNYSNYIYKFNYSNSTYVVSATAYAVCSSNGQALNPMCTDGTYGYMVCTASSAQMIGRFRLADLVFMEYKNLLCGSTPTYPSNITYIGGQLYIMTQWNTYGLYSINYSTIQATQINQFYGEYTNYK